MSKPKHKEEKEQNEQKTTQAANEQEIPCQETQTEEYMTPDETVTEEKAEAKQEDKTEYYLNMARQVQADFDNYRKRNASVYSNALADGKIDAIKAFLTVVDNFDRALAAENDKESSLYKGVQIIRNQIDEALSSLGVEPIGKVGEAFDPQYHNAVMQVSAQGEQKAGEIAEVFVKGYKLGDRVIRHTMVQVTV